MLPWNGVLWELEEQNWPRGSGKAHRGSVTADRSKVRESHASGQKKEHVHWLGVGGSVALRSSCGSSVRVGGSDPR